MPKNKLINDIELWLERWGATCVFNGETYKRYSFRYIKGRPRRGWRITIQKVSGVDETTLRVTDNLFGVVLEARGSREIRSILKHSFEDFNTMIEASNAIRKALREGAIQAALEDNE